MPLTNGKPSDAALSDRTKWESRLQSIARRSAASHSQQKQREAAAGVLLARAARAYWAFELGVAASTFSNASEGTVSTAAALPNPPWRKPAWSQSGVNVRIGAETATATPSCRSVSMVSNNLHGQLGPHRLSWCRKTLMGNWSPADYQGSYPPASRTLVSEPYRTHGYSHLPGSYPPAS